MCFAKRARQTAGFTLVEVLVALTIALILSGVVFQLIRGQSRFVTVQSAREEVQQNTRGALELMASELRSVEPGGLVETDSNSVSFLLPRAWGLYCGGTATQMSAVFPDFPTEMRALNSASGVIADTAAATPPRKWGPSPVDAARATVTAIATFDVTAAGNPCAALRPTTIPSPSSQGLRLDGTNLPTPPVGNLVYLYQYVRYDVAQSGGEWWIRRSNGMSGASTVQQPLAGPIPAGAGLRFRYWEGAAGNQLGPRRTTRADLTRVARNGIAVRTQSRARSGSAVQQQADSLTVLLWNRP
jgi:prepilin-type N-terminal cleavage/methylation domain-containing protein